MDPAIVKAFETYQFHLLWNKKAISVLSKMWDQACWHWLDKTDFVDDFIHPKKSDVLPSV